MRPSSNDVSEDLPDARAAVAEGPRRLVSLVANTFAIEAKRLKDPSVLLAGRDVLMTYFQTLRQLGTLNEHDIALSTLRRQIPIAERYAAHSRAELHSQAHSLLPRRSDREMDQIETDALQAIDESLKRADNDDVDWKAGLQEMRQSLMQIESTAKEIEISEHRANRALFGVNARLHIGLYTRLALQRCIAFVGRHAFIVGLPVLIVGMGYSWFVTIGQSLLAQFLSVGVWGILIIGFVAAVFKEYVISRRVRVLRVRVERRLLAPVVHGVFQASIQGLLSETRARDPAIKSGAM